MSMTQGEEMIANILKKEHIGYVKEKSFSDLKSGHYRFDFYVPKWNACIEFDGKQHFQRVPRFQSTHRDFERTQGHDRQKNSYCLSHNIKLYRIPFWELDKLSTVKEIQAARHVVKSRWHNDELWRNYNKT